ncbi:hypothetical protein QBC47DRAFT_455789 [Echria macrotheca]|uniref:Thiaminase-2/PQQC domain-containing protein n=1 Tax=Echria macrotheca TaxID=438768 RepID=A0AAJ0F5U3_9PEZI|nr:hypothetical protein QBC47DRAFT_455789 [Echria macrotheca]
MSETAWELTTHLLGRRDEYEAATQHPFLLAAAQGRLPKEALGRWLSNDRLYIHSYIRAAAKLLGSIDLPQSVSDHETHETQLVDWLIEALAAVRKEERLFIDVADRYGLSIELGPSISSNAASTQSLKLPGLVMIEDIFSSVGRPQVSKGWFSTKELPPSSPIPWLEGAVTFWGTEKCYLDAWTWAKNKQPHGSTARDDADGGALRQEFIPNWSSPQFREFVDRLGRLIDSAVADFVERSEDKDAAFKAIVDRVEAKWLSLLAAEKAFWPDIE